MACWRDAHGSRRCFQTFDGARLDDIVDYLTFVFLPVLFLYHAGAHALTVGAGWWHPSCC